MVREIKRTRRTELVSPSGTASRMGVVDVYSPNISKMFGAVSDTINTLAENQVKILDAKWQNNFETETTKYLNNKVNGILKSGEKPDLQKFQEETDGYINGVLAGVPERLSINAESYYNQKNLNAFETLRKQANIIEYTELNDSYQNNLESTLADVDTFLENNFITTQGPQESIDAIDQFFATEVTKFLGSHNEKYEALIVASNFKLNKSTQKQAEEALMVSLEQKRVNAIVKSFYQNIDVSNAEQVAEADAEAQLFLRNYSLNEGGVRGVNYEVFEDETGRKIGQEIIDGVVKNGINTYNTTKSLNDFNIKIAERKRMAEDQIQVKGLLENIGDITTVVSNENNLFTNLENGEERPSTLDEIRTALINKNIKATDTEIISIFESNIAAFELRNSIAIADENFSFKEVLTTKENEKHLDTLGLSVEDVVKQQISNLSNSLGIEDSLEGYQSIGPDKADEANTIYSIAKANQVMPYGMEQLFKQVNINRLSELVSNNDNEAIINMFDVVLPQWASLTDNGIIEFDNLNKDVNEIFSFFNASKQFSEPVQIAQYYIKSKQNEAETDMDEFVKASATFSSWMKEYQSDENRSPSRDYIDTYRKRYNKYKLKDNTFMGFSFGYDILGSLVETEQAIEERFNPDYISNFDAELESKAMKLTKIRSQGIDNPEAINTIYNQAVFEVMETLIKEDNYGVSRYAPNTGGKFAFVKDSMESVHRLTEDDALNYTAAFFNMYIKQNYDTDENLRNAFQNMAGNEVKPTFDDIYKFAENGVLELTRIEGTDDYEMKLNLDNAMMFGYAPYPYAEDSISIKVDGMDFNPTKMFNRKFDTQLDIEANKYLDETGIFGPSRELIKKFYRGFKQMDAPFDSAEFRAIDEKFQNEIIDMYERTVNDEAFGFANIITNSFIKGEKEDTEDFLTRTAGNIHNVVYEEGRSTMVKDNYGENVGIIMNTFADRITNEPGKVGFLLDAYTVYQPDINQLQSAIQSGKEEDLLAVFPNMGDYQKRLMLYLFGKEYYETN